MNEEERMLNNEGRRLWDQKAAFWDAMHGDDGNVFHRTLVVPALERLAHPQPGERVLDVACGSGMVARWLAARGSMVTAVDFSAALIERARTRGQSGGTPIDYHVSDATDEEALTALGEGMFDLITCTMALMDMPVVAPLFRAAQRLLRATGRMVFVTAHPAFNSNSTVMTAEQASIDGKLIEMHALKILGYLDVSPAKGAGAPNEPVPHYYYHRPLHELLGPAFAAGLVLDGLEEPAFSRDGEHVQRPLSWFGLWQFPPVLACRLRPTLSLYNEPPQTMRLHY